MRTFHLTIEKPNGTTETYKVEATTLTDAIYRYGKGKGANVNNVVDYRTEDIATGCL